MYLSLAMIGCIFTFILVNNNYKKIHRRSILSSSLSRISYVLAYRIRNGHISYVNSIGTYTQH